jgi:hypothetical protein
MWRVCYNSLHFSCDVWDKIVFVVMYLIIKSVWVNGSDCMISYVNVIALLNIFIRLQVVFLGMHPSPLECNWVSWNAFECLGMHPSATKTIIVNCANAYKNIVFVNGIFTWRSFHVTTTVCNAIVINKTQQCYYQY